MCTCAHTHKSLHVLNPTAFKTLVKDLFSATCCKRCIVRKLNSPRDSFEAKKQTNRVEPMPKLTRRNWNYSECVKGEKTACYILPDQSAGLLQDAYPDMVFSFSVNLIDNERPAFQVSPLVLWHHFNLVGQRQISSYQCSSFPKKGGERKVGN